MFCFVFPIAFVLKVSVVFVVVVESILGSWEWKVFCHLGAHI